jgi:hypothetical protein
VGAESERVEAADSGKAGSGSGRRDGWWSRGWTWGGGSARREGDAAAAAKSAEAAADEHVEDISAAELFRSKEFVAASPKETRIYLSKVWLGFGRSGTDTRGKISHLVFIVVLLPPIPCHPLKK